MVRLATLVLLIFATAWCGVVVLFFAQAFLKSGFGDFLLLGLTALFIAPIPGMWFALRRGRTLIACIIAVAPLVGSVVLLALVQTRLF